MLISPGVSLLAGLCQTLCEAFFIAFRFPYTKAHQSETITFLTVLLQPIFSRCGEWETGSPADHAGKSDSFQSFLVLSIIPTRKTLITTVSQFLLSQIPRHLPALQDVIPWMNGFEAAHTQIDTAVAH